MKDRGPIHRYLFAIACLLSFVLEVVPGRLEYIDEIFFKAAGRHWAATGQFSAPEIVGRVSVQPGLDKIYFAQPPVYTFLFGLYTRLVGFGPHRCIIFDALIHLLLAICTVLLARRVFQAPTRYAYLVGILVLLLGTRARPDELGMCIAIGGILCWTLDLAPTRRAVLCGIAFGVCGATSLGVWLLFSPLALLVAHHRKALSWRTGSLAVICGALAASLCVAPILVPHPLAYRQLIAHASDQSAQMQSVLSAGPGQPHAEPNVPHRAFWTSLLASEKEGTIFALRFGLADVTVTIGTLLVILLCISTVAAEESRTWWQSLAFAACGVVFIWLMMPGKYTYLWFFAPWLLSLAAVVLSRTYGELPPATRALVVLTGVSVLAVVTGFYVRGRLIMLALPRGQAFYQNMEHVRELIPAGAHVATQQYWWALADKCDVVDPYMSNPKPLVLDYLIKTGNGSRTPGVPQQFSERFEDYARANSFVVVDDELNRKPLEIGQLRLTHSAWGFGPYILARSSNRTARSFGH